MAKNAPQKLTIRLTGDWSITGVTQQLLPLTEYLASLSKTDPQQTRPVVDLAEVAMFDACGCQLLAILFRHLKLLGFAPAMDCIPNELRDHIEHLGFGHEFAAAMDSVKGYA